MLLPRKWVMERSLAWATRIWRLAKDCERLPQTGAGTNFLAFVCLMLRNFVEALGVKRRSRSRICGVLAWRVWLDAQRDKPVVSDTPWECLPPSHRPQ